jgi:hypothetical protein
LRVARQRSVSRTEQTFSEHVRKQFNEHKQLIISPVILLVLSMPRLIISFIPSMLIFIIFVALSQLYMKAFKKSFKSFRQRTRIRQWLITKNIIYLLSPIDMTIGFYSSIVVKLMIAVKRSWWLTSYKLFSLQHFFFCILIYFSFISCVLYMFLFSIVLWIINYREIMETNSFYICFGLFRKKMVIKV